MYYGRYYTNGELWDGRSERSNSQREHHVVTCGVPVYADIKGDWHAKHRLFPILLQFHQTQTPKKPQYFTLSLPQHSLLGIRLPEVPHP